jgi:hypothetical protein
MRWRKLRLSDVVCVLTVKRIEVYILASLVSTKIAIIVSETCTSTSQKQQQARNEKATAFTKDVERDERELRHGRSESLFFAICDRGVGRSVSSGWVFRRPESERVAGGSPLGVFRDAFVRTSDGVE